MGDTYELEVPSQSEGAPTKCPSTVQLQILLPLPSLMGGDLVDAQRRAQRPAQPADSQGRPGSQVFCYRPTIKGCHD